MQRALRAVCSVVTAAWLSAVSAGAWADTVIQGDSYAIVDDGDYVAWQTNAIDLFEESYGYYDAAAEFDLSGLQSSDRVLFSFDVAGVFPYWTGEETEFPGVLDTYIDVSSYGGNNELANLDYGDSFYPEKTPIGAAYLDGLEVGMPIAHTFTFDVTTSFNAALANGDAALGLWLRIRDPFDDNGPLIIRATVDNFRMMVAVPVPVPVPEPETYALMLAGLIAVGWVARRRRG